MIRAALVCLLLPGCTLIEHVQVLPLVTDKTVIAPECCVAVYVEDPPVHYSLTITSPPKGIQTKVTAGWKF